MGLSQEADLYEGEALRTTLPDDLMAALAYLMKLTAGSQSVMWMLQVFRCVGETISNCIPSLFADHALPHVALHLMRSRARGPKIIGTHQCTAIALVLAGILSSRFSFGLTEPQDLQIADEVGALQHAHVVAREQVHALNSGWGTAALRTNASAGLSRRSLSNSQYMDRVLFGGEKLIPPGGIEEKMLHLKYLCRVINNLQRLTTEFENIAQDHLSPLVAETAAASGLLETSSVAELRELWGDAWTYDDEHAVLRGNKNGFELAHYLAMSIWAIVDGSSF